MKRVGPRGAGIFQNISWNEALHMLAGRISGLRRDGIPDALVAIDGNQKDSTMAVLIKRFLKAVGSPNYMTIPSMEDTFNMSSNIMMGVDGPMSYDLENADYILSFGSGLLEGWGAPGRVLNAWGQWRDDSLKGKVKVVQVESRASNTASKADQWVAPRPGTEAALALGMAHVIIKKGLFDKKFVNRYSFGFDDWHSENGKGHMGFKTMLLEQYAPKQVARITGLDAKKIVSLAEDFASAGAPIAVCGRGKGTNNSGLYEVMAVLALNALVGNINKPGGILVNEPLPLKALSEIEPDDIAREGLKKQRLDEAGEKRFPFTKSLINRLAEVVINSDKSPVDTLLVFSSNPVFTLPDGGAFKKALEKVPFIVSFSPYQDETSYMADLVLPDHTYLEKREDVVWPSGLQYPLYGLSRPVVKPLYDTKHAGDVVIQLAGRIDSNVKAAFSWRSFEDVLKHRVKGLFDSGPGRVNYDGQSPLWEQMKQGRAFKSDYRSFNHMWKKMASGGLWYQPQHSYGIRPGMFKTPSGRFEFFSSRIELAARSGSKGSSINKILKEMGISGKGDDAFMPHYEKNESGVSRSEYPLTMVPYEIMNLASGFIPSPPFLSKTLLDDQLSKNESFVEINPGTASRHSLKDKDRIFVESPKGRVKVRVCISEGAMPDIVYMPLGFGHTAYDEFLKGKGANPNQIIFGQNDPLSGLPVWWKTPVKIVKV
jgi:anaerobic selenocysteine-containing dehydrogenase